MLRLSPLLCAALCLPAAACVSDLTTGSIEAGGAVTPSLVVPPQPHPSPARARFDHARPAVLMLAGGEARVSPMMVDLDWATAASRGSRSAVPVPIVSACREAMAEAGSKHGAVQVDAASAGPVRRAEGGTLAAPLDARVAYWHEGEVRAQHSRVTCHLGADGRIVALE